MNSSIYLTGSGWGVLITHFRSLFHDNPAFSNFYHFYPEYRFLSQSASQAKVLVNPASGAAVKSL